MELVDAGEEAAGGTEVGVSKHLECPACSKQSFCQFTTLEDKLPQGFLDVTIRDDHVVAFICCEERSFTH